jgi:hypothetical protein
MPIMGEELDLPLDVTPVRLIAAMVLLLIFETVPAVMPLNRIPLNEPVEPVSA